MITIREALNEYLLELKIILKEFENFMSSPSIDQLSNIAKDLISLGTDLYPKFSVIGHRALCNITIDAGQKMYHRSKRIYKLTKDDEEYVKDIYEVFSSIASKIESGEYEESLNKIRKNN